MVQRFVVLDAMGVLYRHGNVVSGVLIPYLHRHDCSRTEAEIRGVTVLVLTNHAGPWSAHLRRRFGLEPYVDHWYVSAEISARKPDAAAYDAVLTHPGLDPAHTVMVDDRPTNLAAARAAGLCPVLFHSEDTAANPAPDLDVAGARNMPELLKLLLAHG